MALKRLSASRMLVSSAYEVFTEKESKRGNNGLSCNLSCAEFVSDFVSEGVRVCVVLLRGLFSELTVYISQLEGDHSPSVQQQCPEVESANLITARSPDTQWEPRNRKNPVSALPMSLVFSSFCSCVVQNVSITFTSLFKWRKSRSYPVCRSWQILVLMFSLVSDCTTASVVYITHSFNHSANIC